MALVLRFLSLILNPYVHLQHCLAFSIHSSLDPCFILSCPLYFVSYPLFLFLMSIFSTAWPSLFTHLWTLVPLSLVPCPSFLIPYSYSLCPSSALLGLLYFLHVWTIDPLSLVPCPSSLLPPTVFSKVFLSTSIIPRRPSSPFVPYFSSFASLPRLSFLVSLPSSPLPRLSSLLLLPPPSHFSSIFPRHHRSLFLVHCLSSLFYPPSYHSFAYSPPSILPLLPSSSLIPLLSFLVLG